MNSPLIHLLGLRFKFSFSNIIPFKVVKCIHNTYFRISKKQFTYYRKNQCSEFVVQ